MTQRNKELPPELTFTYIKNTILVNVLSVVTSSIILGAAIILWQDNESAKLRIGYLAAHVSDIEAKLETFEKAHSAGDVINNPLHTAK